MIKEIDYFSTECGESDQVETSALLYKNKLTGSIINGSAIEKQFETDEYYIIIASYGWAFEEGNYVTLLDKSFHPIRSINISKLYYNLTVKSAEAISDKEIRIEFTNDCSVSVNIFSIPLLRTKPFLKLKRWKYFK